MAGMGRDQAREGWERTRVIVREYGGQVEPERKSGTGESTANRSEGQISSDALGMRLYEVTSGKTRVMAVEFRGEVQIEGKHGWYEVRIRGRSHGRSRKVGREKMRREKRGKVKRERKKR